MKPGLMAALFRLKTATASISFRDVKAELFENLPKKAFFDFALRCNLAIKIVQLQFVFDTNFRGNLRKGTSGKGGVDWFSTKTKIVDSSLFTLSLNRFQIIIHH